MQDEIQTAIAISSLVIAVFSLWDRITKGSTDKITDISARLSKVEADISARLSKVETVQHDHDKSLIKIESAAENMDTKLSDLKATVEKFIDALRVQK